VKRVSRTTKVGILILVAGGILVVVWPEKKVPVEYVTLKAGDVEDVCTPLYNAAVQANKFAHINGAVAGEVTEILVEKGDEVTQGELIIKLKDDEALGRLQLAEANLAAGIASLKQTTIKSQSSRKNLDRVTKLLEEGLIPEANFDDAKTESDIVQKSLDITEADIGQLKASCKIARSLYDATFIRAPFDGRVADIFVEKGESIILGSSVYDIYDDSSLYVEARFDELDASRLHTGLDARITYDTMQGKHLNGSIEWISNVVNVDVKAGRGVDVKVALQEKEPTIRIGMSVEVEVVVNEKKDTRYLPTSVIMGKGGEKFVYVIEEGRATKRLVTVGLSNWDRTEILDGVKDSDRVISSVNLPELREGVRVTFL
jgi:HlyD family secretion protein